MKPESPAVCRSLFFPTINHYENQCILSVLRPLCIWAAADVTSIDKTQRLSSCGSHLVRVHWQEAGVGTKKERTFHLCHSTATICIKRMISETWTMGRNAERKPNPVRKEVTWASERCVNPRFQKTSERILQSWSYTITRRGKLQQSSQEESEFGEITHLIWLRSVFFLSSVELKKKNSRALCICALK